jgi:hypothetical protein
MSFSHKRKGMEVLVSPGPAAVQQQQQQPPPHYEDSSYLPSQTLEHYQQSHHHVVVVSPTNSNWQDVQAKMKDLYQRLVEDEEEANDSSNDNESSTTASSTDPVLLAIRNVVHQKHQVHQAFMMMEQEAARIQQELNEQVEQAKTACQMESEQAHQMQKKVAELCAARDAIVAELQETLQLTQDVQADMARHEQDAMQQLNEHETETMQAKKKAARLQHQISLYARITGIKWDFDQETILAGHVVRLYLCKILLVYHLLLLCHIIWAFFSRSP